MNETALRLGMFAGVLGLMALSEMLAPWRERQGRVARWPSNLGVVVVDTLLLRLLLPISAAGLAILVEARGWGLLPWLGVPHWLAIAVSMVLLDMAIFAPHVVFHHLPWLRLVIVTPDMHRVHHSTERAETDSNFGFNLAVWDRLFGTYIAAPKAGLDDVTIGMASFRDPSERRLDRLLTQPFRND